MADRSTGPSGRTNNHAWYENNQHTQLTSPLLTLITGQDNETSELVPVQLIIAGLGAAHFSEDFLITREENETTVSVREAQAAASTREDAALPTSWESETQNWPDGAFDTSDDSETLPRKTFCRPSIPSPGISPTIKSQEPSSPFRSQSAANLLKQGPHGIQRTHRPGSLQIPPFSAPDLDTTPLLDRPDHSLAPEFLYLKACNRTQKMVGKVPLRTLPDTPRTMAFSGFCTSPSCMMENVEFLDNNTCKCICGRQPDLLTIFDDDCVVACEKCSKGICGAVAAHTEAEELILVCPNCNECTPMKESSIGPVKLKIVYMAKKVTGERYVEELEEGEIRE